MRIAFGVARRLRLAAVSTAGWWVWTRRFRPRLLGLARVRCGPGTEVAARLRVSGDADVWLGPGCYVNQGCFFDAEAQIIVGSAVFIGDHVRLITSSHEVGGSSQRAGRPTPRVVSIGSGSWLGSGVSVLSGVSVAPGCVIAAGAVVVRDTDPDGLYAGVPATRHRDLD